MMFATPQFALLPDPQGERKYANVDNRLEIVTSNGTRTLPVQVPTGLFVLMKDVLNIRPEDVVTLSIDEVLKDDSIRYIFALMRNWEDVYDLWDYSEKSLPAWIL